MSLPKLTTKSMTILTSILLIAGQILNVICPHYLFHVNQIMLLTMLLLEYMVIKQMAADTKKLKESITESQVLHTFTTKFEKHSHHRIISFVLVTFFIATMFAVGCLEPTLTGIYGGVLGAVIFYIGIQTYIHYLSLLHFSSDLKNIQITDYSFYYPALTKWMRELSKEFQFIEKMVCCFRISVHHYLCNQHSTRHIGYPWTHAKPIPNKLGRHLHPIYFSSSISFQHS